MSELVNNTSSSVINSGPIPRKAGRPQGSKQKMSSDKTSMLKQLKIVWQNPKNKVSDKVSAATLYADLMGWRVKTSTEAVGNKEVMKISFEKDEKAQCIPPSNKMITHAPVIKDIPIVIKVEPVEITTTTTTEPDFGF